ncbi:MAG: 3'-5' exonuclease, partial [Cyanobacteria bacterium J06636_27]
FVLVDECQDLNEAQKKLVQILAGSNGRILAVGDPNQAVMGFAGADDNSYYNIVKSINAVELPLSICYRCPTSHINLVKKEFSYIPIQPAPNAPEGVIKQIEPDKIVKHIKDEDMIIGRKTAPLVGLCIRLIGRGKKAIVKGKKIGETLGKECDEIIKLPGYFYKLFNDYLEQYRSIKINQYQGLDEEEQLIETINDKLDAVQTIYESNPQVKSVEELKIEIDKLFSDDNAPITLSTCHRAKGLEAERIFIYHPEHMPLKWRNQQEWQLQQEENLLYVALTRSKSELFICGKCDWYKAPNSKEEEELEGEKDKVKNYSKITRTTEEKEEDNQDYMEFMGVFEDYEYF